MKEGNFLKFYVSLLSFLHELVLLKMSAENAPESISERVKYKNFLGGGGSHPRLSTLRRTFIKLHLWPDHNFLASPGPDIYTYIKLIALKAICDEN